MEMIANDCEPHVDAGQPRVVINLMVKKDEAVQVRFCEVQSARFQNRTSFPSACGIEDVFDAHIAEGLRSCLNKLSKGARILALPEYFIETRGLILAGPHMVTISAEDGTKAVILRFKLMIGNIQNAFHRRLAMDSPVSEQSDHLATLVLSDICLPLLDFCAAAEMQLVGSHEVDLGFARCISQRSHEIRFQIELVKRYVGALDRCSEETFKRAQVAAIQQPLAMIG